MAKGQYLINANHTVVVVGDHHDPPYGVIDEAHEDEYRDAGYETLPKDRPVPPQSWEIEADVVRADPMQRPKRMPRPDTE